MTQTIWPNQNEADFVIDDYRFASGETLPSLKLHYITIGSPVRDAAGEIVNAVLLLHNTSGASQTWLGPSLGGELFGEGQPLDASRHFIIIPDAIGFGGSSKPSDGLRARFPNYRYRDMVEAQHRLLTEGLGVHHLRLLLGISMGGMHAWMWAGKYPGMMDAVVPVACQPTAISGRNWIFRRIVIEAIRNDPGWNGGDYDGPLSYFARIAPLPFLMTESVNRIQEMAPDRESADALYDQLAGRTGADASDQLYAMEAIMDYDPSGDLEKIAARVLAINFADDTVNPPELGVVEAAIAKIVDARLVTVPASAETHGHYTNLRAAIWKDHLAEFMNTLPPRN